MNCPKCGKRAFLNFDEWECVPCAWNSYDGVARLATEEDQPKFNYKPRLLGEQVNPYLERQGMFEALMEGAA